jgi:hypothetical protein
VFVMAKKPWRGAIIVVLVALAAPAFAFWLAVSPAALRLFDRRLAVGLFRLLDAPTAALNAVLPWSYRIGFQHNNVNLRDYLLVGFPAYALLGFGLTSLSPRIARRFRGGKAAIRDVA